MTDGAEVLSLAETAERLGISISTAKKLAASGELPATKVGGQWRVHRARLEAQYGLVARSGNVPSIEPERISVGTAQRLGPGDDGPWDETVVTVHVEAIGVVGFSLVLTPKMAVELGRSLLVAGEA